METMQKRFARPVLAAAIAMFALVFAFSGVAQAADKITKKDIAKGAVTKKAIKKGAVTKKAIKANAVTAKAIADSAVTTSELADGAVTTPKIADGAVTASKLGDDVAGSFGVGLLGAEIDTPAANATLATIGEGPAIGSGSDDFDIPVPTAMKVTDIAAVTDSAPSRVVEIRIQKNGSEAGGCEIAADATSCTSNEAVSFAPGDSLGLQVFVQGGAGTPAVGANTYAIGYRATP
jgi:hypothetical protein